MKNCPYGKGIAYNATTSKLKGIANQLILEVQIATPDFYPEQKVERVFALLDTGATGSGISKCYADKLGLQPTSIGRCGGVGGMRDTSLYDVVLHLNDTVRNIKLQVSEGNLHRDDGGPDHSEIGFLIGMDVLGHGDFFTGLYKDKDGKPCTMFSFRIPTAFQPVDYLQEVIEYNKEQAEKQARIDSARFRRAQSQKPKHRTKR
ncbi:MAG: aspartyl protease family protein [Synergistaceae bacterium]|jgi:hypothetical protein|nr:aspartyl protease family protein [Synergistaceae bacterium]